ncbi:helix-turn-helix transcriptional regulator [Longimicrobium sp.]|jgi:transcriptional regulator with XRE-family HTH domain|uniref:helix-turn-helix transcriptional regulator n=1 Tax=Longimicrobium sp. TaxID=2029185 RepID=UPI002ED9FD9D
MKGDLTWEEYLERELRDPEVAASWAESLPKIDLAVNVCLLRMERGLSQKQLAEAAGLSQPRITDIERSDANPTLLTITRIANALGVRVERLFADKAVSEAEAAALPQAEVVEKEQTTVPQSLRKRKRRAAALVA